MDARLGRPLPSGVGRVSQWFGERPEMYRKFGLAGHNGLDYSVKVGTAVLAAHEGIVTRGEDPEGYGRFVRVINGYRVTIYGHLSSISVKDGERVQPGQQLGLSGNTGNSTGPHLHFGLKWIHGTNPAYLGWVDPKPFRE
jgi:murein DD-endopeptidase MepM/ murein hydrolase activator NlpD